MNDNRDMMFPINDEKAEIVNKENIPACDLLNNMNVGIGGIYEEAANELTLSASLGFRESHYKACQDGTYIFHFMCHVW